MKQLIIFNPSIEDGGVEKNLFLISNYLSSKGLKIKIICSDNKKRDQFNKEIEIIYPKNVNFKNSGRYKKYLFCLILLLKEIIKNKNTSVISFQANIYALIICLFYKIKIITRMNTSPTGWDHNIFKNLIFSFLIKLSNKVVVNSYEFKNEVDKKYNIKSLCIHNPFDFKRIKKLSNKKIQPVFKKKTLKLINIGRLTDQKNQILLLKAVKIIKKKLNIQLLILGKGANFSLLKSYINENKLKNVVKLIGYKKNPYPYLKQADVFVLSSNYEGSPNVLVEAMFLKKSVISTRCPTGPTEILKNGKLGKLIKVNDTKSLVEALNSFKKNHKKINSAYNSTTIYDYNINCLEYYKLIKKIII